MGDDTDEAVQRVVVGLLCRQQAPALDRRTLGAVAERQLTSYWRSELRYRRHLEKKMPRTEPAADYRQTFDTAMDVQEAMASLPEEAQQVCAALSRGASIREVAHELGVSWHTVNRHVASIRRHFERLGLGSDGIAEKDIMP